ncbi:alcohol dehydrogenase YqhD (iron-dependent ADH family) [Enterococcus sp. PF1-24]|uniref:iron-containing alcohol dehydrogenase n=1 Tax=unclassified Enterococcus TaxID=2608891 RepID=UPI0024768DF3|nr:MULTISPECIES: iron-containing alcohol dehydrogenase [unclassified Enterococcus]MDH6363957.1 alcohol dehydrogenase YqhD (iron-dependent ADH family) [Enterococcus sp. PFB1-1]MDH6401058.1 alcohol dehydrogenase YqhD (iron-dependent ADH family) [Enterococcus sp. PF1-24]
MENFTYYNPAKIIFGKGSEAHIATEISLYAKNVLLVYGGNFIKELGIYDALVKQFDEVNITYFEFNKVIPNPRLEHVKEAITICKENEINFILAIGGGSAIDTAKAVAVGALDDGDVWDFYTGKRTPQTALPIGTVLTLPSSGSEMSNASIISKDLEKLGLEHDLIIPKFSVLNPEYTLNLPSYQTAVGIADIFSHLLERYFSESAYVHLTDHLLEGAMKSLLINSQLLQKDSHDYNCRAEIMWSASVAHNNLLDTGRISDWGSHRIEHEISAQYNVTHGEGMAIIFPAWMAYVAQVKPEKLAQLAIRVFNRDAIAYSIEELALFAVKDVQNFFLQLGMKKNLTDLQIDNRDFSIMAQRATKNGSVGHYITLDAVTIEEILTIALDNQF